MGRKDKIIYPRILELITITHVEIEGKSYSLLHWQKESSWDITDLHKLD